MAVASGIQCRRCEPSLDPPKQGRAKSSAPRRPVRLALAVAFWPRHPNRKEHVVAKEYASKGDSDSLLASRRGNAEPVDIDPVARADERRAVRLRQERRAAGRPDRGDRRG
jgi:hypothetical protein